MLQGSDTKMPQEFDAVILANGEFPKANLPLEVLESAHFIACCDGAIVHWPQADVVIGDGDSVPETYRSKLIRIDEQEDNDLTKATRYCIGKGCRRIAYLGCTGRREDHTLGNISLMVRYHREFHIQPTMLTDNGWFVVASGTGRFASAPRQQVSLFNVDCRELTSKGLRWQAYPYSQLWQGTLNEAVADSFRIDADGTYLVYRTYETKAQR